MQIPRVNNFTYAPPPTHDAVKVDPDGSRDDETRRERRRRSRRRAERDGGRRAEDASVEGAVGDPFDRHGHRMSTAEVASLQARLSHSRSNRPRPGGADWVVDLTGEAETAVED